MSPRIVPLWTVRLIAIDGQLIGELDGGAVDDHRVRAPRAGPAVR